jgi:hypothetical protein
MEAVQPAGANPAPDRLSPEPKLNQLLPPNDPVLSLGQGGDSSVNSVSPF